MEGIVFKTLYGNDVEEEEEEVEDTMRTYENAVVLYEDKKYYPDAEEVRSYLLMLYQVYKGVEVIVQEEDMQDINEPIIKSSQKKTFFIVEKSIPETVVCFRLFAMFISSIRTNSLPVLWTIRY